MMLRVAAAVLAGGIGVAPAVADEYRTYENLEVTAPGVPACRATMLVSLPPSWVSDDGAAILVTAGPELDAARHTLVSALLSEHAAVLELAPLRCGMPHGQDGLIAAALGALDAMKRTLGAGLVVAIGYGPGSAELLDVVGDQAARLLGPDGARYAAAISMGDGAPGFARGGPSAGWEQAPMRLAALCEVLAGVAGSLGTIPQPTAPASAAAACRTAIADDASPGATQPLSARRWPQGRLLE